MRFLRDKFDGKTDHFFISFFLLLVSKVGKGGKVAGAGKEKKDTLNNSGRNIQVLPQFGNRYK